ncbi:C2 domain-containing protein [Gorgonomyces haynaldii]|nr:C2 domain-containing protein [Gorgonomyces haynaldii]
MVFESQFGILKVTVVQAKDLKGGDLLNTQDAYCKVSIDVPIKEAENTKETDLYAKKYPLLQKTQVVSKKDPIWQETLEFRVRTVPKASVLYIECHDKNMMNDCLLGEGSCVFETDTTEWIQDFVITLKNKHSKGTIKLVVHYQPRSVVHDVKEGIVSEIDRVKREAIKTIVDFAADTAKKAV